MYNPNIQCPCGLYFLVVKSVSRASHVQDPRIVNFHPHSLSQRAYHSPAGLAPHRQVGPLGVWFSAPALLQVHLPTGRAPHEQVGPVTEFSWGARSQVQCWAACLPQVQVASWAGGAPSATVPKG